MDRLYDKRTTNLTMGPLYQKFNKTVCKQEREDKALNTRKLKFPSERQKKGKQKIIF